MPQVHSKVIREFHELIKQPEMSTAVAAIKSLTVVVSQSSAVTVMELEREVKMVVKELKKCVPDSIFTVNSGCELFVRSITRPKIDVSDFNAFKQCLVDIGESVVRKSLSSRNTIATSFLPFIQDGITIMTAMYSRVVIECLIQAVQVRKRFQVYVCESRPDGSGYRTAKELVDAGIPVTVIMDGSVGYFMDKMDLILIGAEAVVESGGIICKPGISQLAIVAKTFSKPMYCAVESYKFARFYPLTQDDLPNSNMRFDIEPSATHFSHSYPDLASNPERFNTQADSSTQLNYMHIEKGLQVELPRWEYTHPKYITLLCTDLGVLTPSAVSDELIKLYLD